MRVGPNGGTDLFKSTVLLDSSRAVQAKEDSCRCCAGCALNPWPLCVLDVQIRKPLVSININLDTL